MDKFPTSWEVTAHILAQAPLQGAVVGQGMGGRTNSHVGRCKNYVVGLVQYELLCFM